MTNISGTANESELFYSNDLCCAFLARIVQAFQANYPKGYLGRTAMQKLTYFVKVLGVPVPCSFGIYTHGPYLDTVTFKVDSLLADDVIADASPAAKYSNYQLGVNANQLLSRFAGDLAPHRTVIEQTVEALGRFEPRDVELIATLHVIAQKSCRRS